MISGILAIVATAGWIAFAAASRERKRFAADAETSRAALTRDYSELMEAERKLEQALALNSDLSREVARLKEELNKINV